MFRLTIQLKIEERPEKDYMFREIAGVEREVTTEAQDAPGAFNLLYLELEEMRSKLGSAVSRHVRKLEKGEAA